MTLELRAQSLLRSPRLVEFHTKQRLRLCEEGLFQALNVEGERLESTEPVLLTVMSLIRWLRWSL